MAHSLYSINSPRLRVPHPCVLCKGGYHRRISLRLCAMNSRPCSTNLIVSAASCPPLRLRSGQALAETARAGHPPSRCCQRDQKAGQPGRLIIRSKRPAKGCVGGGGNEVDAVCVGDELRGSSRWIRKQLGTNPRLGRANPKWSGRRRCLKNSWLPPRDSNPDNLLQRQVS